MRSSPIVVAAAIAPLLGAVAHAQVTHVPGDFSTIQDALDASPAGEVIVVHGGTWGAITIRRPVTLIGDPQPSIGGFGGPFPPVTLDGPGLGKVTLSSIFVGGVFGGNDLPSTPPPGIHGGGFEALHIIDTTVVAPQRSMFGFTGLGLGNSAIVADVPFL